MTSADVNFRCPNMEAWLPLLHWQTGPSLKRVVVVALESEGVNFHRFPILRNPFVTPTQKLFRIFTAGDGTRITRPHTARTIPSESVSVEPMIMMGVALSMPTVV